MAADRAAAIDRELGELNRRHIDACDRITQLLISVATIEYRRDVLLDRRLTETR